MFKIILRIGTAALLTLVLFGTVYTKCFRKRFWNDFVLTQNNGMTESNEKGIKVIQKSKINLRKSFLDDFLISFSIVDNYEKLCSVKMNKKTLSTIHGLR